MSFENMNSSNIKVQWCNDKKSLKNLYDKLTGFFLREVLGMLESKNRG